MLTPASFAAPAQRSGVYGTTAALTSENALNVPVTVQEVRHARLPCTRVPGPPLATASSTASVAPTTTTTTTTTTASATAVDTAPSATTAPTLRSTTDTTLQAAQQLFASSGPLLRNLTNSSLYVTVRNTLDGSSAEGSGDATQLDDAAQQNLLNSPSALTALKARFNSSLKATHNGGNGNNAATGSGVEWKKLQYVRQQCRFTGQALVTKPPSPADGQQTVTPAATSLSAAASSTEPEKSVGARFMQSLLHPFTSAVPAAGGASVAAPASQANASQNLDASAAENKSALTVPHGEGVMTYVLYAMPRTDYDVPAPLPAPFLSSALIPTNYCPPLSELEEAEEGVSAAVIDLAEASHRRSRLLLLSLVVFEGTFVEGRRHGRGRLTVYGRFVLECTWVHDVPCLEIPQPRTTSLQPSSASMRVAPPTLRRISAHVCASATPSNESTTTTTTTTTSPTAAQDAPLVWYIRSTQLYMGSLALAALGTRRLLSKLEALSHTHANSNTERAAYNLMEVHGARYVQLSLPSSPQPLETSWSPTTPALTSATVADTDAFHGLTWADHVVLLPDGFGEAHYYNDVAEPSAATPASAPLVVRCPPSGLFHPPIWIPESRRGPQQQQQQQQLNTHGFLNPALAAALCTQFCGAWVAGSPHGFGVEVVRVTDPACAPLSLSAASAGAGPPQYPWRSLFLGQHVCGERRGPGTAHGLQGSEGTEVVVCGTWPRLEYLPGGTAVASQEAVNVVLLPPACTAANTDAPSAGRERGGLPSAASLSAGSASSFFTLQGARWTEDDSGGGEVSGHGCGGGTFPSATLRQSPAPLSGMWEPLFARVDACVAQPSPTTFSAPLPASETVASLSLDANGGNGVWHHARRVMDRLTESPECVSALEAFQACFACMYGYDTAAAGQARLTVAPSGEGEGEEGESEDGQDDEMPTALPDSNDRTAATQAAGVKGEKPSKAMRELLARLQKTAAVATGSATGAPSDDASLSYPWCPQHSWCGLAHFDGADGLPYGDITPRRRRASPQHTNYAACVHDPLSSGATHRLPAERSTQRTSIGKGTTENNRSSSGSSKMRSDMSDSCHPRRRSRRPPLSAVAAALEPYAAAHTFTHAMHAAAAMVSSVRLRLLSCFAAYPDLCEMVMAHTAHDAVILRYCWDVVYRYVGPILQEKATAVAAADVRLVWDLLGLDRVRLDQGGSDARAARGSSDVTVSPASQPEGKETLRDYVVAVRRCRTLACADVIDASFLFASSDSSCGSGGSGSGDDVMDGVQSCAVALKKCMQAASCHQISEQQSDSLSLTGIIDTLQDIYHLLYNDATAEKTSTGSAGDTAALRTAAAAAAAADAHSPTLAQRESVLRWLLLAASDPTSHLSSRPDSKPAVSPTRIVSSGHPFALLLIAGFILGGRVTPSCTATPPEEEEEKEEEVDQQDDGSAPMQPVAAPLLLRLVRDMGYAARQLIHTHPSTRAQTFTSPLAFPLDLLSLRLEYVLSPCATHCLLPSFTSTVASLPSNKPLQVTPGDTQCTPSTSYVAEAQIHSSPAATARREESVSGADHLQVYLQLDQLPTEVLQWCNAYLTDNTSERLLQTRLRSYWGGRVSAVPRPLTTREKEQEPCCDRLVTPTPLMRWVLGCLRGLLAAAAGSPTSQLDPPQQQQQLTHPSPPPPPPPPSLPSSPVSSPDGHVVHSWKKFINAVFFSAEEKKEWRSCAATAVTTTPSTSGGIRPLSRVDYVYLVALAYTLRELAGLDLTFTAQFILQGEEDDDEDESGNETTDVLEISTYDGVSTEEGLHRSRKTHTQSTGSLKDRRRNIFLSSSSSSASSSVSSSPPPAASSLSNSPITVSPVSSPPPDATRVSAGAGLSAEHADTRAAVFADPALPPTPSATPSASSALASAHTFPRGESKGATRQQLLSSRGPSTVLADASSGVGDGRTAVPLGKEWFLSVRVLQPGADGSGAETQSGSGVRSLSKGLTWEVMERVCSLVEFRMLDRKTGSLVVENESHPLKPRQR